MAWFRRGLLMKSNASSTRNGAVIPTSASAKRCSCFGCCTPGSRVSTSGQGCRSQSGHRPAIRGRVSAGGACTACAAVESQSPGERDGRLSPVATRASFEKQPATTIAEACERIFQLTGFRRGAARSQVPQGSGPEVLPGPRDPRAAKKKLGRARSADQAAFLETELKPVLAAAQAGKGHVFFVDAAHFVFGTFLCYLWSFTRIFVRASGRQRFDAWGRGMR